MARGRPSKNGNGNGRKLNGQGSVNAAVKAICDVMRRSNCAGAMKYVPELTWILFLRILDEREAREAEEAQALGLPFASSLAAPFRWRDWADKDSAMRQDKNASVWKFVHEELLPHLKTLEKQPGATARQKVISEVMSSVERSRIDSEKNFLDVLDKVHDLSNDTIDQTHVFTLSQVYEGLLLKMGEKGNDGGQFFTPRDTIRVMIRVVNPAIGKTVYDPGCGTGGFLAQAFEHMREEAEKAGTLTATKLEFLKRNTFFGREKDDTVYPIALANLLLHGIDDPHIWHGNTLSGQESYGELFKGAPQFFDCVLMNPPFGGKEGKEAQTGFDYPTSATQVLFIQHVLKSMRDASVCGIVLDEGVLFRTNEGGFVQTKRKLLEECAVYCIVSLPGGVFSSAGAGVKTNLVFFRKGQQTEKIWYYDLSDVKVGKKKPLTKAAFEEFFKLLPSRGDSERSWTIDFASRLEKAMEDASPFREKATLLFAEAKTLEATFREKRKSKSHAPEALKQAEDAWKVVEREARENQAKGQEIEDAVYDLKAVNPHRKTEEDTRTPSELLDFIGEKGAEADAALARLRKLVVHTGPAVETPDRM
ncbi:MAG: N-6 DNA methylase [Verrucomicrobia bacterium]|nr:N-6 DNA methylase [Verrucomicrobiota bacterium]